MDRHESIAPISRLEQKTMHLLFVARRRKWNKQRMLKSD
jgi:hypothetical protein